MRVLFEELVDDKEGGCHSGTIGQAGLRQALSRVLGRLPGALEKAGLGGGGAEEMGAGRSPNAALERVDAALRI